MMIAMIDPFELHPDTPRLKRSLELESITVGQLNEIIGDLSIRMHAGPDKIWGQSRTDIEYWLRMVVHEAEKVVTSPDN